MEPYASDRRGTRASSSLSALPSSMPPLPPPTEGRRALRAPGAVAVVPETACFW